VKVDNIGLCNIVAGETMVRELIQEEANPVMIYEEISNILTNNIYSNAIRHKLAAVREKLGTGGASRKTAQLTLSLLESP
jgi:lipid-A-disaccharide synthase